jgi:hypothetical protein
MAQRREEEPPAGYADAFAAIQACGAALEVSQDELDQMRERWGLEPVGLPPLDLMPKILGIAE